MQRILELIIKDILNLKIFSCKSNVLNKLTIENCPNLEELIFSMQGEMVWIGEFPYVLENNILTTLYISGPYDNLKIINHPKFFAIYDVKREQLITYKDFPALTDFGRGTVNDPAFEKWYDEHKEQQRQEEQARNRAKFLAQNPDFVPYEPAPEGTKPPKDKYRGPADWYPSDEHYNTDNLDISNYGHIGHLTIDGHDYPNLRSLNIGGNEFCNLTVRNCLKLVWLNYAHNQFDTGVLATIDNCPELLPENIHNENYDGKYDWRPFDLTDEERPRSKNYPGDPEAQALLAQCSDLSWQAIFTQLTQLDRQQINPSLYGSISKIIKDKFNTEIIQLMIKYQNNQITQAQFLAEIEQRQLYFKEFLNDFTREQLERLIGSLNAEAYVASPYSAPLWPWVGIGLSYLALLSVIIIVKRKIWFLKKIKFYKAFF